MRHKKSGKGGKGGLKKLARGFGKMGKVAGPKAGGGKIGGGGMHVGAPKVHHSPRGGTKAVHAPSSHRGADPRGRAENPLPSGGADKRNREKRLSGAAV